MAEAVLARYELDEPRLSYLAWETNLLYSVTERGGRRLVLRLASPGWRTLCDLRSEALWLEALVRDTDVPAPRIVSNRSGQMVTSERDPSDGERWNASLMTWVPGRCLGGYLTESNVSKMGALFATLHAHGRRWARPAGFTTRRFDHWLSRGEPNRIFEERSDPLLFRMDRAVRDAYAGVDSDDLRVIHCDLWHGNIRLYRGVLHPFDFEDTLLGFRAHDIGMAMLDLLETVGEDAYPRLRAAFRDGYAEHLPWPSDPIEPFQIGRLLWKLNWVARHEPSWTDYAVQRHLPVFEEFERSGAVVLPR